jgi:hypothetical protein
MEGRTGGENWGEVNSREVTVTDKIHRQRLGSVEGPRRRDLQSFEASLLGVLWQG